MSTMAPSTGGGKIGAIPKSLRLSWPVAVTPAWRGPPQREVGELRLDTEVLLMSDETDQRLIAWLPSDGATNVALERICDDTRPGPLRIVG